MRWFRSHRRRGAWLALFALALQLALTFAHVHPLVVATAAALAQSQDGPAQPEPGGPASDPCAVCTLIQMAGTLVPASSPALALPVAVDGQYLAISIDRPRATSPPRLFQARAPPVA
jgi:hypothetical protein